MYKRIFPLFVVLSFLLVFFVASSGATQAEAAPIRLNAVSFTPGLGERPTVPPGLSISAYAQGQRGYYIVQFAGPVQEAWKEAVIATGAELLDYIPDFAFKVRMNPVEASAVAGLGSVAYVDFFQPAYKLSPDLERNGTKLYRV